MIIIKEILDLIVVLIDPRIDLHIDMTLVIDIDLALILEITTLIGILLHSDHPQHQEILDTLHPDQTQAQETNFAQFNYKLQMILSTLKYTCIISLKWQVL